MITSRSSWEKLVELWDISEVASVVSKALASLYMLKVSTCESDLDLNTISSNVKECEKVLKKFSEDLELYMDNKASETVLVTILIDSFGDVDVEKIKEHLSKAIKGVGKLNKILSEKPIDRKALEDGDLVELERVLSKLSDTLSKKVERMANEIYAF